VKKKLLALLLTVAMVVTFLPFSALVSAEDSTETTTTEGVIGTFVKVPEHSGFKDAVNGGEYHVQSTELNFMGFTSAGAVRMYKENQYGEWFWKAPHTYTWKNASTPEDIVVDMPVDIRESTMYNNTGYGASDLSKLTFDDTNYIAIRLKFNDYSNSINYSTAGITGFNVAGTSIITTDTIKDTYPVLWFDLENGTTSRWYAHGLSDNNPAVMYMMGNMDGYMLIPIKRLGADNVKTNKYITYKFEATVTNDATKKKTSWKDKELLIGDALIVDKDTFVAAKIKEYGTTKYHSATNDSSFIAQRIPSYEHGLIHGFNMYRGNAGKVYARNDASGAAAGDNYHYVSLPNGDRAIDISRTAAATTSLNVYPSWANTYDNIRTSFYTYYTQGGVPSDMTITYKTAIAFRIASTGNEDKEFYVKYGVRKGSDSFYSARIARAGGVIKYLDIKTGEVHDYTLTDKGITVKGNLDGWFIVPDFTSTYFTECGSEALNGYFDYMKSAKGWGCTVSGFDSSSTSQKFFFGDVSYVSNMDQFINVHSKSPLEQGAKASLTLEDAFSVNIKINKTRYDEIYNGNYTVPTVSMKLEGRDTTTTVKASSVSNGMYVFTYSDIPAQKMGDTLTTTLTWGVDDAGDPIKTTSTYSVKQYAVNKLNDTTASAELKTAVADMLNYGASVQQYCNYKTDALVNDVDGIDLTKYATGSEPTLTKNTSPLSGTANGANWKAVSLKLEGTINMLLKFNAEGTDGLVMKIYDNDDNEIASYKEFSQDLSGAYFVHFRNLNADQMRENIKAKIFDADGNQVSETLTYSIQDYVASKQNHNEVGTLVKNMLKYGDAVAAYAATLEA